MDKSLTRKFRTNQNTALKFSCINKIISAFCLEDNIGVKNFATVELSVTLVSVTLIFASSSVGLSVDDWIYEEFSLRVFNRGRL